MEIYVMLIYIYKIRKYLYYFFSKRVRYMLRIVHLQMPHMLYVVLHICYMPASACHVLQPASCKARRLYFFFQPLCLLLYCYYFHAYIFAPRSVRFFRCLPAPFSSFSAACSCSGPPPFFAVMPLFRGDDACHAAMSTLER